MLRKHKTRLIVLQDRGDLSRGKLKRMIPNKILIELNKCWVCDHLHDVTGIETQNVAWVLVQEPGFIGFGVVQQDKISWPPSILPDCEPDWKRVSDLRLFGEKGEWHVWRDWDGKHYARLLKFHKLNDDNSLTEYHFLWGTKKKKSDKSSWIKLVEDRGAEIWIPPLKGIELEDANLPLRLKLKQVVDYDPDYHLAGIVDAALIGLVRKSCERLLIPSIRDCSGSETTKAISDCPKPDSSDTSPDA